MPSGNTSIIFVLGAILLLTIFYLFNGSIIPNDGTLQTKPLNNVSQHNNHSTDSDAVSDYSNDSNDSNDSSVSGVDPKFTYATNVEKRDAEADDAVDSSREIIRERAMGLNGPYYRRKNGNKYKYNSYRSSGVDKDLSEVNKQFNVEDINKNYTDRFVPVDDNGDGNQAPFNSDGVNMKGTEKDKYNSESFLPQQKEKDWFETIETVDVKNTHLINIYRPIGANTIGSTHKGAIYDIRGLDKAVCPKFVVSPFLNSSWEPDRSSKSLCA